MWRYDARVMLLVEGDVASAALRSE